MANVTNNQAIFDGIGLTSAGSQRTSIKELGQDQFMELMIAQLKNQDPTKPLQNGEFLGQLAQFGTVNGIQDLQKSFSGLSSALQSNQALMASSLVGRSVLIPGGVSAFDGQAPVAGSVDLTASAANLEVGVYDGAGQLVRRLPLGSQAAGRVAFGWDGRTANGQLAPAGQYWMRAEAVSGSTKETLAVNTYGRVESVSLNGANGMNLNVAGLGSIALGDVKEIR
jgi:flagellar basal-body rod modification protein FlgD